MPQSERSEVDKGVLPLRLDETPYAIVDFETTGVDAKSDRIVEVAIRRIDPRTRVARVFDSLVNPDRPMGATQIHGIRDDDVQSAPRFEDIAGTLVDLLSGAVLTSYNVLFDARFLQYELLRLGVRATPPLVCLMLLKPMLGLGGRCSLGDACMELGVEAEDAHLASSDAHAAEGLLRIYLEICARREVITFHDLQGVGDYDFLRSLRRRPLPGANDLRLTGRCAALSRRDWPIERRRLPDQAALRTYYDALSAVLADLVITDSEFAYVKKLQEKLRLTREQMRALHGRAFLCIMMNFISDDWLDDREVEHLRQASSCLAKLGWTPGF